MMHRYVSTFGFALLPCVCAIVLASPAKGATLTQSVTTTFGTVTPQNGVPVLLSQFDPSFGTLTGVTLDVVQSANNSILLTNPTTSTQTVFGSFSYTTGYNGPGLSLSISPITVSTSAVIAANGSQTVIVQVPFNRTTSASTLAEYLGTGNIALSFFYAASGFSENVGGTPNGTRSTSGSASGTSILTATYTYTPVPEPVSTAGCLAFSLLVLKRRMLRNRTKVSGVAR